MGHSNGVISAPVNTDDVGAVLGYSSHDVATLCIDSQNKINMWARNKPENTGGPAALTDAQRKANNFGLRAPATYHADQYRTAISNGALSGWTYDKVSESKNSWFRLTDFENYNSDSVSPFPTLAGGTYAHKSVKLSDQTYQTQLTVSLTPSMEAQNSDSIKLADLQKSDANYSEWYAGVILISGSNYWIGTSVTKLGSGGLDVIFRTSSSSGTTVPSAGTYSAYAFLASSIFTAQTALPPNSSIWFVPLTTKAVEIKVVTSSNAVLVSMVEQNNQFIVRVENNTTSNVIVYPKDFQYSASGSFSPSTTAGNYASISVGTGQVATKSYRSRLLPGGGGMVRMAYTKKVGSGTEDTVYSYTEPTAHPEAVTLN